MRINKKLLPRPLELPFPLGGIDLSEGFDRQPAHKTSAGVLARTTPIGQNVRAYEPLTGRARGGSRPGLTKYIAGQVNGTAAIQDLNVIVGVGYSAPGGGTQSSGSGRIVTLLAVSQGNVFVADAGTSAWVAATNDTGTNPPLSTSAVIRSSVNNQKLYFVDGVNARLYDPSLNKVRTWGASAGTYPQDSSGRLPRLICTYRGRTVLSAIIGDPQNWFMSKVGDPTDFNYSPTSISATQAVAGNNSALGLIGDVVTALIPHTDDVLFFGGDSSIWLLKGDPMSGGQINLVSDEIGVAFGEAWCKDPAGTIYFMSNKGDIYALSPGQQPQRLSRAIDSLLEAIDTGLNTVRLVWDDNFQGLHVFVTTTASAAAATHYSFEPRTGAWWTRVYANNNLNPLCCVTFDGNLPTDRVVLHGSWDGYVRTLSPTATDDDGTAIASSVVLGPVLTPIGDEIMFKELQAILGENSGSVSWSLLSASTAEAALAAGASASGSWLASRNPTEQLRLAGRAHYLKITASGQWQFETARALVQTLSRIRSRSAN